MALTALSPTTDPTSVRFRLRNARAGVWLSVGCALVGALFYLLTWERPHRPAMMALALAALVGSVAIRRLPLERIMRRPVAREAFFLGWSAAVVVVVALGAILDGGADSPLVVGLFWPLVFAAISYPVRSMLAVGAMVVGAYLGVAIVQGGAETSEVVFVALALAAVAWLCAWQAHNHGLQHAELARASRADPLTDCLNRRGFEERLAAELAHASRAGAPVGLVLLDLDDFKAVNDAHGHAAGDDLLCWTVGTLSHTLRPMDAVGRLGGDEFAVVVPGAGRAEAEALAVRLRDALAPRAPASSGVAAFPADGTDGEELHHHADLELYLAKHGRAAPPAPVRRRELSWAAALARAVDLRMAYYHEHSASVGERAVAIGRALEMDAEHLERLRLAALLHDIGKVAVPDHVLRKPASLSPEEEAVLRTHPGVGADMVARIEGLEVVATWIRHSHEHVDGSGYPDGLAGEEIPLESRILLVADAFDAMTSDRPYRAGARAEVALAELRRCAGRQFDARCVDLLAAGVARTPAGAALY